MKGSKYTWCRLALAAAAVLAGAVYLTVGKAALPVILPVMSFCFLAIAVVAWREAKASGLAGVIALLPALAAALVAVFALIGTAVYFVNM